MPDVFCLRAVDVMMPIVPMFHVNAWCLPFAAALVGASLVLPGPRPTSADLVDLANECRITCAAGVPTIWLGFREELRRRKAPRFNDLRVTSGGAACPLALMESLSDEFGILVTHAWGMTELSPLGVYNSRKPENAAMSPGDWQAHQRKQGRPPFLVDLRAVDAEGHEVPNDGTSFGELEVRGPWVIERYFNAERSAINSEGWFPTGDIVTLDASGYIDIVDRAKDVIKSGGEWISSVQLENLAVGHPQVGEAAVIGARHPHWDERPVLLVTARDPMNPPAHSDIIAWLDGKIARWWMPDMTIVVNEIPHTGTGKLLKTELKRLYGSVLDGATASENAGLEAGPARRQGAT